VRLLYVVLIIAASGVLSFIIGECLPRRLFHADKFPYRAFKWERGGKIYINTGVRRWKDIVPDMSKIVPGVVKKKAFAAATAEGMRRLVAETCVAEFIHVMLIIIVTPLLVIFGKGAFGIICAVLNALGNLMFVIIQRYNRPRLVAQAERMEKREKHDSN